MNELKPCPFCGGRAEVQYLEPHVHMSSFMPDHHGSYVLECTECDGVGMIDDTRQGVIDRWNTRASDWVSVTEFESNAEDGSWCWICHKGDQRHQQTARGGKAMSFRDWWTHRDTSPEVDPEIDARVERYFSKPLRSKTIYPCPECGRLKQENEALKTRLEINPELPEYDGIACRDETIKQLEAKIHRLEQTINHNDASVAVAASEALQEMEHGNYHDVVNILKILAGEKDR